MLTKRECKRSEARAQSIKVPGSPEARFRTLALDDSTCRNHACQWTRSATAAAPSGRAFSYVSCPKVLVEGPVPQAGTFQD